MASPVSFGYILCLAFFLASGGEIRAEDLESPSRSRVLIELFRDGEGTSRGTLFDAEGAVVSVFSVGYGREGWLEQGSRFRGGFSLLGTFRINAILAPDRFEMAPELMERSGRDEEYLRKNLFRNMDSIDFDADGEGGEYGEGFFSLDPVSEEENQAGQAGRVEQPFAFGRYKGVFRLYSFAIHGTQDEARVGRASTGGCVNVGREALSVLLNRLRLGDAVEIVCADERGSRRGADRREDSLSKKR